MKVDIPSFSGNLAIEFFLDWIYKVDKFFDVNYVPTKKQVKFVAYKLKGGQLHGEINCKSHEGVNKSNL